MSVSITNVNSTSDTFENWLDKTNQALYTISTVALTAAANTTGGTTTGNVVVDGVFSANTLVAIGDIRGGTVSQSANLTFSSNVNFAGANVGGDVTYLDFVAANVALSSPDITLSGGTLTVTSNVNFKSNTVFINTAGRLGVNTGSPDAALSVSGSANISGNASFSSQALFNSNTLHKANTYISLNNVDAGYIVFGNTLVNMIGFDGSSFKITGAPVAFDNNLTLNSSVTGISTNASITVNRGTTGANAYVMWNEATQKWSFTNDGTTLLQVASNTDIATLTAAVNLRATIASPALTGTPTAPTVANTNNSNTIATTAFVNAVVQTATASLGTLSTQNANNVTITGGTINGVVVGTNARGARTISTSTPTGGSDGDIWYRV